VPILKIVHPKRSVNFDLTFWGEVTSLCILPCIIDQ